MEHVPSVKIDDDPGGSAALREAQNATPKKPESKQDWTKALALARLITQSGAPRSQKKGCGRQLRQMLKTTELTNPNALETLATLAEPNKWRFLSLLSGIRLTVEGADIEASSRRLEEFMSPAHATVLTLDFLALAGERLRRGKAVGRPARAWGEYLKGQNGSVGMWEKLSLWGFLMESDLREGKTFDALTSVVSGVKLLASHSRKGCFSDSEVSPFFVDSTLKVFAKRSLAGSFADALSRAGVSPEEFIADVGELKTLKSPRLQTLPRLLGSLLVEENLVSAPTQVVEPKKRRNIFLAVLGRLQNWARPHKEALPPLQPSA